MSFVFHFKDSLCAQGTETSGWWGSSTEGDKAWGIAMAVQRTSFSRNKIWSLVEKRSEDRSAVHWWCQSLQTIFCLGNHWAPWQNRDQTETSELTNEKSQCAEENWKPFPLYLDFIWRRKPMQVCMPMYVYMCEFVCAHVYIYTPPLCTRSLGTSLCPPAPFCP